MKRLASTLFSLVIAADGFAQAARAQSVTDSDVAIGCHTDVVGILADGTGPEMHTHADSVTYTVTPSTAMTVMTAGMRSAVLLPAWASPPLRRTRATCRSFTTTMTSRSP